MREGNKSCNAGRDSCYTVAHRHSHFPLRAPARTTLTASPRRHRPSPSLPSSTQHTTSTGTVPPVTSWPQHTHHAARPSRTHATTVLATQHHHTVCPHRPPPQPTQPAPHGRSQHTSLFLTSLPSNDLLLTDLYSNKLAQQGLLLTSAPVQLSAPHRQFVQQGLLLTSARTYTHRHSTTSTQHPRLQLNLLSQQHVTSTLTLHFQLVSSKHRETAH
jgi:hypothetical protein